MSDAKPVFSGVVTLDGTAQSLGAALSLPGTRLRVLAIQPDSANLAVAYVGGPTVDSTNGMQLPTPVSSIPAAPFMLEGLDGKTMLDQVYVKGTANDKLHVLGVAYV